MKVSAGRDMERTRMCRSIEWTGTRSLKDMNVSAGRNSERTGVYRVECMNRNKKFKRHEQS